MKSVNSYNVYYEAHPDSIIYHAIAEDENEVLRLADEADIDLMGMCIELDRKNVKDGLGRPYEPKIEDVQVY